MRPYVVVRLMACVYQRVQIPDEALTGESAEAFAANIVREKKMRTWLVLSRRVSVYFDADGRKQGQRTSKGLKPKGFRKTGHAGSPLNEVSRSGPPWKPRGFNVRWPCGRKGGRIEATPEMPCEPYMTIGGRRFQFDFDGGMGFKPIDGPGP